MFPEARTDLGDGLLSFDMGKIREKLEGDKKTPEGEK